MLEKETGGVKKDSACVFHVRTQFKRSLLFDFTFLTVECERNSKVCVIPRRLLNS